MKDPVKGTHLLSSTLHQCFSPLKKNPSKSSHQKILGEGSGEKEEMIQPKSYKANHGTFVGSRNAS